MLCFWVEQVWCRWWLNLDRLSFLSCQRLFVHRLNLDLEVLDVALALRMKDLKMLAESIGLLSFLHIILMLFCPITSRKCRLPPVFWRHLNQSTKLASSSINNRGDIVRAACKFQKSKGRRQRDRFDKKVLQKLQRKATLHCKLKSVLLYGSPNLECGLGNKRAIKTFNFSAECNYFAPIFISQSDIDIML